MIGNINIRVILSETWERKTQHTGR